MKRILSRLLARRTTDYRPSSILCGLALLMVVSALVLPAVALAEGLEVGEVRTENYPRVIVRFSANMSDGLPVTDIKADHLQVWENNAAQQQVDFFSLRETSPELWVALVVDVSGSMADDGKLDRAKEAAKAFTSRLRAKDRTAIVTFSDKVILHQQPTGDPGVLRRAIDSLQAKGPTRMNDGLARGVAEVLRAREGARRAVILLSDGEDTGSETDLAAAVGPAVAARVPIYTVGLGTDAKMDILTGIARDTKARFYAAPQPRDLDYVFKLLSGQLSAQYEAWWQSSTTAPAGTPVAGRLRLQAPNGEQLETTFSYVVPVALRPPPKTEHQAAVEELRPVELPRESAWDFPAWWPYVAAFFAAFGVYLAYSGLLIRLTCSRTQDRLLGFVASYQGKGNASKTKSSQQHQSMRPLILNLARFTHRLTPTRLLDDLRRRLVLAGRPSGWQFSQFLASKVGLAGVLAVVGYLLTTASQSDPIFFMAVTASLTVLGWYLPHFWLGAQIRRRQKLIQRALPDTLDLMTVGVGAGLSLDGAILEIVEKADNPLTHELANFLAEMRMGRSRREALQGLESRTGVEDIKVLVASLIQADELGMSLSDTLMVQADQMRMRRRQRAEELAHKATVKMMIPMILLIFPALFVVIIGPAVPSMLEFLVNGGG